MTPQIDPDSFNSALAHILSNRREELDLSLRTLEEKSGVNYMTIKRILETSRPMRINDFEAVARAMGLTPWKVAREAEERLSEPPVSLSFPSQPPEFELAASDHTFEDEQPGSDEPA